MNLVEIRDSITENINQIEFKSRYTSNSEYLSSDLNILRKALNNVSSIPYIREEIESLNNSWLFKTTNDQLQISSSDDTLVSNLVKRIRIGLQFLLRIIEDNEYSTNPTVVYIKLPELDTFEELSRVSNDLKKGIELPILDGEKGNVNILTAEKGSIWLVVSLGAVAAVKLVAAICWAATVIRRKNAEAKIFEQHAKTLELKNMALDDIINAQKQQINNILTNEATAIINKHYDHNEPETLERLKLSISTVANLIEKGAQILPASSDNDVLKSFPDYSSLGLIESTIKQLTENK